jgi:uncharacterized membrane-anchored protein
MRNLKLFLLSLCIPIIVLLSMTFKPLLAISAGEEIKLQTVPYDPRDLFYGDYVDLQFEVERVELNLLDEDLRKKFNQENNEYIRYSGKENKINVFITLKENSEGIHQAVKVSKNKPQGKTYIKGVLYPYSSFDNKLEVNIPIERYYVEENTGKKLEEQARQGELLATLKVYKGYSILKSVELKNSLKD